MTTTLTLLDLAGAVALLLWGIHMVQTGIQRAFGSDLRRLLGVLIGNRLQAFGAGIVVTAALQSSTATGLMVASLAADGLVATVPALAVMLGANVGTTLMVQLLSFDMRHFTPLAILAGVAMFRFGGVSRTRDLGRAAIGLGLILIALTRLLDVITPYEDMPSLRMMMGAIATDRILAVFVAALATWMAHSSAAVVLLVMSFATKGVVPLDAAIALVVGANLGAALNPVIEGRGEPAGRRIAIGNFAVRAVGAVAVVAVLPTLGVAVARLEPDLARAVADFHTAFNVVLALAMLPLLTPFARLLRRCLPDRAEPSDPSRPLYLDPAAADVPALAIGHAAREALRMSDLLQEMIATMRRALDDGDRRRIVEAVGLDDALDRLNAAIKSYLSRLDPDGLDAEAAARLDAVLAFVINLEHAGDIVQRDVAASVRKYVERGFAFSRDGEGEMREVFDRIATNLRTAASVFVTENVAAARLLAGEKQAFRTIEARILAGHFSKLREAGASGRDASALHLDLIRDLKRINDHLVAGAAYPVLERGGDLMATRLRQDVIARL